MFIARRLFRRSGIKEVLPMDRSRWCAPKLILLMVPILIIAGCRTSEPVTHQSQIQLFSQEAADTKKINCAGDTSPNPQSITGGSYRLNTNACGLLTSDEIRKVQGEPISEAKPTSVQQGGFSVSQCVLTLPTPARSVSLTIVREGNGSDSKNLGNWWKERFDNNAESESADKADRKERDEDASELAPPRMIFGLGDSARWTGGALYMLKGNAVVRISIGGTGDSRSRIDKSRSLARFILRKL